MTSDCSPHQASPCSASVCASASWSAPSTECANQIRTYCQNGVNYDADLECASWTHLWMTCAFTHLPWSDLRLLQRGVLEGRSGRGIVYVISSGNEHGNGEDVNHELFLQTRYTMTVGATDKLGHHAYYSTTGSSLFISAPGGDTSAHANNWHVARNSAGGGGCVEQDQGTSYACPVVSGVVALILEANPLLTYRDVQGILAATTTKNNPTHPLWTTNAAGFIHNIKYGFGMVDAGAAVAAALSWTNWGIERRIIASSSQQLTVPYDGSTLSTTVTVGAQSQAWAIEWIEIFLNLDHSSRGDLQLELTSPSGTHSVLTPGPRPETSNPPVEGCSAAADTCATRDNGVCNNPSTCDCDYNDCLAANWVGTNGQPSLYRPRFNWKMTSVRTWGERPTGRWTLAIRDRRVQIGTNPPSTLRGWNLFIYGHHGTATRLANSTGPIYNSVSSPPPPPPPAMSVVAFVLELAGEISSFTSAVREQMKSAIAIRAGVDPSAVTVTVTSGSVIVAVRILTPTATAASVHSAMVSATSTPNSATSMFASVSGYNVYVLTIRTSPTVAAYTPPSSQDDVQEEGLDEGMIIAIAVGASVGALLFVIIFFYGMFVYSNSLKPVLSAAHAGRFGTSPDGPGAGFQMAQGTWPQAPPPYGVPVAVGRRVHAPPPFAV